MLVTVAAPASAVARGWFTNRTVSYWQVEPGAVSHVQSSTKAEIWDSNEFTNVGIRIQYQVSGTTVVGTLTWGQYYASRSEDRVVKHEPNWIWR
ncbi:hypothetical protein [Actinotalea ferrariae]|uniref:hypothetical protein n=1 Tax=Actinotalea ferrariae TaxID=1386098 RepID=UPI001C8B9041|nr:hypothetical protein [Actinotalea ferrariae]